MNKKNICSVKKAGRPRKKPKISTKMDLSIKEPLTRIETMAYLGCGKTWLNDQYKKEGGLMEMGIHVHKWGRRVFFDRIEIDKLIKNLP